MPAITKAEQTMRLAAAEEMIEAGRWTIFDRMELAQRFGVTLPTVNGWAAKVEELQLVRLRQEISDPEIALVRLLANLRFVKRTLANALPRVAGDKAPTAAPLVKLIELEARLVGLGDRAAQHVKVEHAGSVSVLVEGADPVAQARAVVQSLPMALGILGIPCDPEIQRLPAMLDDLVEGRDLLEAVEVEVLEAE